MLISMRILFCLFFLFSCSSKNKAPTNNREEDLVSLQSAIMHAQASYIKGCVDAMKDLKVPLAFHGCRDKSIIHRQELETFLLQDYTIPKQE